MLHIGLTSVRAYLACCVKFWAPWCTKRHGGTELNLVQSHKVVGGWNT